MNPTETTHLSDEQFAVYALGMEQPLSDAAAHLSECPECTEELARFGASVAEFSTAAMGWSESRSPMNLRQVKLKPSPWPRFAMASGALAAGFLVAAGVSIATHHPHGAPVEISSISSTGAAVTQAADCSETEIAQDNKLMQDVNMAIGDGEPSPFRQYRLGQADVSHSRSHGVTRNQ